MGQMVIGVYLLTSHLDFINVMTYDYHGHWEARTSHNSPLFKSSIDSGSQLQHNIVRICLLYTHTHVCACVCVCVCISCIRHKMIMFL